MQTSQTKRSARVLHWDDERSMGNGIMVTLAPGFAFEPHADERVACHVHGYDTVWEANAAVRSAKRCECARCKGEVN